MTDQERIAELEQRLAGLEMMLGPRLEAVLESMMIVQGMTIDALAMLAVHDRALVESVVRMRRLSHQQTRAGAASAEMVKRYEIALDIADQLATARPLRPQ